MNLTVKIKGLNELKRAFAKYPKVAAQNTQSAIHKSIYQVQRETTPITPWDTRATVESLGPSIKFKPLRGEIGPTTKYSIFIHEGTSRWPLSMPPKKPGKKRQFLKIGLERSLKEIEGFFEQAIKNTLNQIIKY
jgi:hypothetical protein